MTAPPVQQVQPQRADGDILIARPELGPDAATLVIDGDPIPAALSDRPRRPARPEPPALAARLKRAAR